MKVLDKSWHVQCVKCSECQCPLSEKCFSRESKLYCRSDFFRQYGTKCAGCGSGLCPEDLVRRAINKIYHVQCFCCNLCKRQLATGEQLYLVQGERFLCESCYHTTVKAAIEIPPSNNNTPAIQTESYTSGASPPDTGAVVMAMPVVGATPGPQPSTPAPISSDGKKSKTRTSITPQQLEVLMAVYNREQRPSKLVREDLMAKTGLEMKVIQVWFQNRRSKEKRDGTTAATPTTTIGTPTVNAREELGAVATPIASIIATPMDEGAHSIESPLPQMSTPSVE
ncbi:hypothetical protein EMCRGX_G024317 [Ephydatia muelleri]